MKVLVVGGGGREHAIVRTLAKSPKIDTLYCAPGNGGIAEQAQCVPIKATDVEAMVAWAKEHAMDFVMTPWRRLASPPSAPGPTPPSLRPARSSPRA